MPQREGDVIEYARVTISVTFSEYALVTFSVSLGS